VVATAVLIETASRSLARAPFYSDGTLASRGRRPGSARRNTPTQRSRPPPLYPAKTRETVHRTEMETPPPSCPRPTMTGSVRAAAEPLLF